MKYFLTFIVVAAFFFESCSHTKALKKNYATSLELAASQYKEMDKTLADSVFPKTTDNGKLVTNKAGWWTSGFFPGSLWYLYEHTRDEEIKLLAIKRSRALEKEKFNINDHDIGFKIYCSFGNALRITKDQAYAPVIIEAARSLTHRFNPTVGSLRSWGNNSDNKSFVVIIDNMMNLELLFEASKLSKDTSFYNIAVKHANTTMQQHYRPDGSSYHVVDYDPITGSVIRKRTAQGYADESAWARGQAWGLYGFTMCYRETHDKNYLDHALKIANFLLKHPNLPQDKIPYWDFNAPNIPAALRDASAAAIMASALLELSKYVSGANKTEFRITAEDIIKVLSNSNYRAGFGENNNFLLKHSVGHMPNKTEIDVPLSYADYYYIEALMRLLN